jgi:hypothetical protein
MVVGKSSDAGSTFSPPNTFGQPIPLDDRMWNVADTKNNAAGLNDVFMTYHDLNTSQIWQVTSTDGGISYNTGTNAVINPTEVTTLQWASSCPAGGCIVGGPSVLNGNELGNIVARRTVSGLKLYTIFTTPDSPTDNQSGTGQNRVFEGVGTVTDNAVTGTPQSITWDDYEIWRDPVGTVNTKIFPVTAIDANGKVYAFWSDAKHIYEKSSPDGINWGCTVLGVTTGNCDTFTTAPQQIDPLAGGAAALDSVNTSIMPWVAAGANGAVDLVWYGSHGGAAGNENDTNNIWNVYFAQTIDGFSTWNVVKASDHVIHRGVLCTGGTGCTGNARIILDFFQVSIDPTNGAADITWTDDSQSPGAVASLWFTRQCTGTSATTLSALSNDCSAPPPPPPPPPFGSTCPGPQILDPAGDAPNNYPSGDGSNMPMFDILNAFFNTTESSGVPTQLIVTLTLNNLSAPPPPNNMLGGLWVVGWKSGTDNYTVEANSNGTGSMAVVTYVLRKNGTVSATAPTGSFNTGPNGTIVWTVPASLIGNPPHGARLTNTFANDRGTFAVQGNGLQYTAAADGAPPGSNPANPGYGADYFLSPSCLDASVPETPVVPLMAVTGGAVAAVFYRRRYRKRGAAIVLEP